MEKKNNLDPQYNKLLEDILTNGVKKQTRNGEVLSVFGRQIRHDMSEGFPLLTGKKMFFKGIVTELLWFLRGDTNIKFLVDNNCHIWDGDAYKNYASQQTNMFMPIWSQEEFINKIKIDDKFAKKWGELGPIYGKQWREWTHWDIQLLPLVVDQIQNLINDLKTNPDSRRLMVNAWNVGEINQMTLPPCHYGFQVYTRELTKHERWMLYCETCNRLKTPSIKGSTNKETMESYYQEYNIPTRAISLMWNQRSVDTFLGLPFNIASYGLLLEIIAKEVNMVPEELIGNLGDVHLYSNHIEQAKEQIGRELSLSERREMVTQEMFNQIYNAGGPKTLSHSEIDQWGIPRIKTREPFPLPTFDCPAIDEIPHTTFDELVFKLQPADFYMDDYQSHPTIKAPLSN